MNLKTYLEIDPDKKDSDWANTIVTHLRTYARPIVNERMYWKNMSILRGDHDMSKVTKLFKEPDKSGASFVALTVMEKLRNVIIAEIENSGIHIALRATDPTATNQKQRDKELLANRKLIESQMSYLQQSIGMGPYSLKSEKGKDGRGVFSGDVESFDRMGLDDSSNEDLEYFYATYYRLMHEMTAEDVVNFFVKYNELQEMSALLVNDILASKRLAVQVYVDEIDGAIKYSYICPAELRTIKGSSRDYKDAMCWVRERDVTVGQFIRLVGNEFDYERDMARLLRAVNAKHNTKNTNN